MKFNHLKFYTLLILSLFLFVTKTYSQKEGDRILAVVGYEIILESDLQYQVQLYARQNHLTQINPMIAQQIFQQMLTEKIIYARAEQDSITVKEDEITKELDYRIKNMVQQVGSEKRLEEIYGMSIGKIKLTLKDDLLKKMKSDKLKAKKFHGGLKVSDKEVETFYKNYKDSIPQISEEFELAHIYMQRKVSEAEKKAARDKAQLILDSVMKGIDFSELAKRNSDDIQSGMNGGDLGYSKKGVFVKEFEEALYTLNVGEVSGLVETEYGYHIIKLNDKKGEQLKSQHILVAYPKFESSDMETITFLNELKGKIESGSISFEDAAKQYSQDVSTNLKGGNMGFISTDRLDSLTYEAIKNLDTGKISVPLKTSEDNNYGYEIIKMLKKNPAHTATLDGDFERIRKMAVMFKENTEMEKWIEELKKTVYVDVKF